MEQQCFRCGGPFETTYQFFTCCQHCRQVLENSSRVCEVCTMEENCVDTESWDSPECQLHNPTPRCSRQGMGCAEEYGRTDFCGTPTVPCEFRR